MKAFGIAGMTLALAVSSPNVKWADHAAAHEGISGGVWGRLDNKLIYAGGTTWRGPVKHWLRDTAIYTLPEDKWSAGPLLPESLAYGASLRNEKTIELLGGINDAGISLRCWRLGEDDKKWEPSGVMPAPTVFAKADTIGRTPYLFGGCKDAADLRGCSNAMWKRTERGDWVHAGSMPVQGLAMPALAVVDNRAYLFGGCSASSSGEVINRRESYCYDPRSNGWKALNSLPHAVRGMTAVALNGGYILLLGGVEGRPSSPPEFSKAVYVYDVKRDRYEEINSLPFGVMGMEAIFDGHSVWGVGGEDKARSRSARLVQGILSHE